LPNYTPTVANVFPLLYSSHFEQISDGLNPNEISIKNINSSGRYDYEFLKVPIVNIQEPTSSPSVTKTPISGTEYKYMTFTYTGSGNNTPYSITFPENTECDILVVGGGGGASGGHGGGGGAGQLVFVNNAILNGTYNIAVGKKGIGGKSTEQPNGYAAIKGFNSSFGSLIAEAGGTNTSTSTDKDGGSGAGGDGWRFDGGTVGFGVKNSSTDTFSSGTVYSRGNDGGSDTENGARGGGGGGAGVAGSSNSSGGDGLSGISEIGYDFRTNFGTSVGQYIAGENKVYFAGGGGGGGSNGNVSGGKGGGGVGTNSGTRTVGASAIANTGSGGGGNGSNSTGGDGGSGIVFIRYRIIKTVPGFLNYTGTDWIVSNIYTNTEQDTQNADTSNYTLNTSNVISTRITNLPQPNLAPYRLVSDSYTKAEDNTFNTNTSNYTTNTSNVISTRINNIASTVSSQWTTSGANINYSSGNVGIGAVNNSYKLNVEGALKVLDTITAANIYVSSRVGIGGFNDGTSSLFVNGLIKITEAIGTVAGANSGSLLLDHENAGGASSITFRSKVNRGSDYGYIQYQDANVINGGGESARLIIGVQNDGDDHICLMPSGNVGIGLINPRDKLEVAGHAIINGSMVCYNIRNTTTIETTSVSATGQITALNINATNNITAGNQLLANGNIFGVGINASGNYYGTNDCTIVRQIFMTGALVTSTTYAYSSVTVNSGSQQINIPIKGTYAYIYCYFGDIGSNTLYIKEGNSYTRRTGTFGNTWDFAETYYEGNHIRIWYHWRSVGDRITSICQWFN